MCRTVHESGAHLRHYDHQKINKKQESVCAQGSTEEVRSRRERRLEGVRPGGRNGDGLARGLTAGWARRGSGFQMPVAAPPESDKPVPATLGPGSPSSFVRPQQLHTHISSGNSCTAQEQSTNHLTHNLSTPPSASPPQPTPASAPRPHLHRLQPPTHQPCQTLSTAPAQPRRLCQPTLRSSRSSLAGSEEYRLCWSVSRLLI